MNEYRFHLQKYKAGRNTKQTCPQCGRRKCFVRYVDEEGKIEFPDYVGRCDHEDSCGYHYTPKDFFRDNPDTKPNNFDNDSWRYDMTKKPIMPAKVKAEPVTPSFIPPNTMQKTLSHYDINPFTSSYAGLLARMQPTNSLNAIRWELPRNGAVLQSFGRLIKIATSVQEN